jgi:hypothetical protein
MLIVRHEDSNARVMPGDLIKDFTGNTWMFWGVEGRKVEAYNITTQHVDKFGPSVFSLVVTDES